MSEPDRISYAFGMKLNLGNYESADFHISLSSDVGPKETREEALLRIQKFIEKEAEKKAAEIGSAKTKKEEW